MKNYVYRVWPLGSTGAALDQMTAAHQYRNRLCELELARRERVEQTITEMCPEWVQINAVCDLATHAVEAIGTELGAVRARARSRSAGAELAAQLKAARLTLKELRKQRKAIKDSVFDRADVQAALELPNVEHRKAMKDARAATPTYWGTYLIVEDAAKDFGKGPPPRFNRWTGEGTLAVQIQGGLPVEELAGTSCTRVQLLPLVPDDARHPVNPQDRQLRFRIGSQANRRVPIFADFRIRLHRDLPADGQIKWVKIFRRVVGTQVRWSAMFTVDAPPATLPVASEEVVAVHCGWRTMPDGPHAGQLRVAVCRGSDGREWEEYLDPSVLDHLSALQSHCDQWFETVKSRVRAWCNAAVKRGVPLPEWLTTELTHLHAWRSHERMHRLAERVYHEGFAGDNGLAKYLEWWRVRKDRHLKNWIAHRRSRANNHRTDKYRVLACRLAQRYRNVSILGVDWTKLLRSDDKATDRFTPNIGRRNASFAAPGLLTRCLREKFGARVLEISPQYVTGICNHCSQVDDWDHTRLEHTCTNCEARWDQDQNAVRNQLAISRVRLGSQPALDAAAAGDGDGTGNEARPRPLSKRQENFRAAREARRKQKAVGAAG